MANAEAEKCKYPSVSSREQDRQVLQFDDTSVHHLVAAAAAGDSEAFERLVVLYEKMVYGVACHLVKNREDACDITQEVFLKAYLALPYFECRCKFSSWLYRITQNTSLDFIRKTNRMQRETLPADEVSEWIVRDWEPSPDEALEQAEREDALQKAIGQLSEKHQEVILLRDMQGYSYEEIADMLGLETGTVKSRLHRARRRLCKYLRERNFFE